MNWMQPYTIGTTALASLALPLGPGLAVTGGMTATYVLSVATVVRRGGPPAAAITTAGSYLGIFATTRAAIGVLVRNASELDATRQAAIERSQRLAAEQERNRQQRRLHDSALQELEAIGGNWVEPEVARSRARRAAAELRQWLAGDQDQAGGDTETSIGQLVGEFADRGLTVEFVVGNLDTQPAPDVRAALHDAAREALTNVLKHAQISHAVLHLSGEGPAVEVIVRDHGRGFDPAVARTGFGLPQSIVGRLADVGGTADIWSRPGRGTRVRLRGPA
jgi:signal transduction histidine kinase